MSETPPENEISDAVAGQVERRVMRFGCTGTHGGENKMCDHCANNIENYPETPEGEQAWKDSTKIDEMVCRLPIDPDRKYWTQYIALHTDV